MAKKPLPDFISILEHGERKTMPWKNGGGTTAEIAIHPPEASLGNADFFWRVSAAQVSQEGPFSHFAGCERWLAVTSLGVLSLHFTGTDSVESLERGRCLRFSGDVPVMGKLPKGPVEDFGVIWRRNLVDVKMQTIQFQGKARSFELSPETIFLLALGPLQLSLFPGEHKFSLGAGDVARLNLASPQARLSEHLVLVEPKGADPTALIAVEIQEKNRH